MEIKKDRSEMKQSFNVKFTLFLKQENYFISLVNYKNKAELKKR